MKIYSNIFDLARPVQRQIYVAPNSVYAFGIKIVNTGVPETDFQLKVFQNGTEIQPMNTTVDGFKLYQRTSSSSPAVTEYDVVYVKGSKVQHFDLVGNTTNSTVFDIDQEGVAFDLPIASASVLGGIKVGNNLTIDAEGKLSIGDNVALKTEIPTNTSLFEGEYEDGTPFSINVYTA